MTAFQVLPNSQSPRWAAANSAASSVITNDTTERAFDQVFSFPAQSQHYVSPGSVLRMRAYGILSTGLLNLGATIAIRWGGVAGSLICSTGAITLGASQTDSGWFLEAFLRINSTGNNGDLEGQGNIQFESGILSTLSAHMPNTSTLSIDTTIANDVSITWKWGTQTANNSAQLRIGYAQIDGP